MKKVVRELWDFARKYCTWEGYAETKYTIKELMEYIEELPIPELEEEQSQKEV